MSQEIQFGAQLRVRKLGAALDSGALNSALDLTGQKVCQEPQLITTGGAALTWGLIGGNPKKALLQNLDPNAAQGLTRFKVSAAAITSGGAAYTAGDVLTVAGPNSSDTSATITVNTVAAGVITAVTVTTAGSWTTSPASLIVTPTGGTGANASLTLTLATIPGNNITLYYDAGFTQPIDLVAPGDMVMRSPQGTIYAKATTTSVWLMKWAVEA
jgi:hypothetical protein